ncbi:MAG: hypothetical protein B7X41_13560 [Microbacterium sp. 14-71-5]|nr:MAG: hypothetical protein B7X41_13560 [Microbacterium sp. 14-71-5]
MLPVVGGALDIGVGVWDIAQGGEPVDVAVAWGSGVAGGLIGGSIAGFLEVGTLAGAGVVGLTAMLVGGGLVSGWQSTPPSWREGIYSWSADGLIVAGDLGEEIGDWWTDRWMDLTGGVAR